MRLGIRDSGLGIRFQDRLFDGVNFEARVIRARVRQHEEATVALTSEAALLFLSTSEAALVNAIAARIIPGDDRDPGAEPARVT